MNPLADINNICFLDFETRAFDDASKSDGNVKTAGTYRYVKNSFPIISTWAIGDGPVFDESLDMGFSFELRWKGMPEELHTFHERVMAGKAWYAAFNAGFDRNVWNNAPGFPPLKPHHMIDVMAQVIASNLPPSLEGAGRALGLSGKQDDGSRLINLFCPPGAAATPQTHPEEWERFKSYGRRDTALLREVWRHTRPLPLEEWEDYWVSETINERGVGIDLHFVERAAAVAQADKTRSNELLTRWTNGQITSVTQVARITQWVYDSIEHDKARALMVRAYDEDAEEDDVPAKLGLDRGRIEKLLAYFADLNEREGLTDREALMVDVLTLRQFGGGSAPAKFQKMLDQHDGGRVKGQYVFNGAGQTGRFSAKGVQIHNLTRSVLKDEPGAIEMINEVDL